jgi:hypothetical protein
VAVQARVDDIEAARLAFGLDDAFALVAGRFFRREVRVRARACVAGMLSGLERKTVWLLALGLCGCRVLSLECDPGMTPQEIA